MADNGNRLDGKTLWIHPMTRSGARMLAAVFRSSGIDARVTPPSDARTLELGAMHSSGEECLPEKITIGDYLKIVETEGFDPSKNAFFMPAANGPCRFGQYWQLLRSVLDRLGHSDVQIVSPSSANGYRDISEHVFEFFRTSWIALLAADILRKLLLKTRPYERAKGTTDQVYERCLDRVEELIASPGIGFRKKKAMLAESLVRSRDEFRAIDADYVKGKPFIAVIGEIFCRHNRFANDDMIRKLEENGAETWIADVGEWIFYTDWTSRKTLRRLGRGFSLEMAAKLLKTNIMRRDEHFLLSPFHDDFEGYEEPEDIGIIARHAEDYLPAHGALGEMSICLGRSGYSHEMGVDGIVDISPFSCMNGIVSEAVYPSFSHDHDDIPCRVFYYDGVNRDLDRDLGIFMELVKGYRARKKAHRRYPAFFREPERPLGRRP